MALALRAATFNKLKERSISKGDRRDRARLEILVFAYARAVNSATLRGDLISVEVNQAGVQFPTTRDVFRVKLFFNEPFDAIDEGSKNLWIGFGADAAMINSLWRMIVIKAGKLPVAEPINRTEKAPLLLIGWRWVVF